MQDYSSYQAGWWLWSYPGVKAITIYLKTTYWVLVIYYATWFRFWRAKLHSHDLKKKKQHTHTHKNTIQRFVKNYLNIVQGPVSWRPTTIKWRQFSQSNRHSTIDTRQTEYHEALPLSANVQSHLTSSFADDGNPSWYSVCRVPMLEWWLDGENCRHLTVVGLHDTGPGSF